MNYISYIFSVDPRQLFARNVDSMRPHGADGKDVQHREQYYGTVRKSCQQSPRESVAGLERIPEYSEDIYPYATFHLPEHENQSANIPLSRKGGLPAMYDPRGGSVADDNTLSSTGAKVKRSVSAGIGSSASNANLGGGQGPASGECSHTNTEKRHKRRSKAIKSESEEYDSLNSDSDLSGERMREREENRSGRESSSHLDDSGYNRKYTKDAKNTDLIKSKDDFHSNFTSMICCQTKYRSKVFIISTHICKF